MIYFTSDTHFYHANIINLSARPFHNYEEMHHTLINNWNAVVSDKDEIYILGDFIHKGNGLDANKVLTRLNGRKYLIRGNHDKYIEDDTLNKKHFEWMKDYDVLDYEKTKFVLCHYPIVEWDGFCKGSIHLYGHVHNSRKDPVQASRLEALGDRAFNVGVDVNNFFPVSIDSIMRKM